MAGTAWLLQFIEDLQQSREFHKTCELKLLNDAATIPEVLLFLSTLYSDFYQQLSIQPAHTQDNTVACYTQLYVHPKRVHRRAPFSQSSSSK